MQYDFSLWAPKCRRVDVIDLQGKCVISLTKDREGYFNGNLTPRQKKTPLQYQYLLDGKTRRPDPKAEYFVDSVHGYCCKDFTDYDWKTANWTGLEKDKLVIYELHVGCFSEAGSFQSTLTQLPYLKELGINTIELMPIAQSAGRWNWGYDGVGLFAVNNNYGTPKEFKQFVDACHSQGISVILDVVYNHIGPEGNYLSEFGPYVSHKHGTPWGDAFNFDGKNAQHVRQFILENVLFLLHSYQLDGLRLDAIHFMKDESEYAIQQEICDAVRQYEQSTLRKIHLIGESNVYDHQLILDNENHNYCAIWADDLMHAIYSLAGVNAHLTAREYRQAKDVKTVLQDGYVYEGPDVKRVSQVQKERYHGKERSKHHLSSLITALQTHDSCGNHPQGKRLHQVTSVEFQRAAIPLILLYPAIPMIFMGEEISTDSPFLFFADFGDEHLRKAVDKGRKGEFPEVDDADFIHPCDSQAYHRSKISLGSGNQETFQCYKKLLKIRKEWQESGLLSAENLTVLANLDAGEFTLHYAFGDNVGRVEVKLNCQKGDYSAKISLNGEVITLF